MIIEFSLFSSLIYLFYLYIIIVVIFIIMENRESSTTVAWLLILLLLPLVGLFLYIFIGRDWRKNSKKKRVKDEYLNIRLNQILKPFEASYEKEAEKIDKENSEKSKLMNLLYKNSYSFLSGANNLKIIQKGEEKFDCLIKDLEKAKKFIHMEYYIWRHDKLTTKIKDILIRKAKEGIEIKILYDALGSFFLKRKYKKELKQAGVKLFANSDFVYPFKLSKLNYRNHRKIVIIDGKVGYTGGMNMGEEQITGGSHYKSWRDTHLRIEGQAVSILEGIFAVSWFETTKEKSLFYPKYFPYIPRTKNDVLMQFAISGPDSKWDSVKQLYFHLINSAKKKVYIQTPYFVPDKAIYDSLKTAALSGIEVILMLTGEDETKLPYYTSFTYFKPLLEAGVRIYHYKKGLLHSKTVCIDSEISSFGTANMDMRSFNLSYELSAVVYNKEKSKELESAFLEDLKYCDQFRLWDYKKLGIFEKFRNSLARLLSPLL